MATSLQPVKSWKKPVEVVKRRILAGWAQKSPEPWEGKKGWEYVSKRGDLQLQQRRERADCEKDTNVNPVRNFEWHLGHTHYNCEIVGSDEDQNLTKRDMGGGSGITPFLFDVHNCISRIWSL